MRNPLTALFPAFAVGASVRIAAAAGVPDGAIPAVIGGVAFDRTDPGEPFVERQEPTGHGSPAHPTPAERAAGMIPFTVSDPGDFTSAGVPGPSQRVTQLRVFLTPGECEPVVFGVHAVSPLRGLRAGVDPRGAPVTVDVRRVHFWPQRTGWRSREWYLAPELLLPCEDGATLVPLRHGLLESRSFDLAAGRNAPFWLTLECPRGATAGTYPAVVALSSAQGSTLTVPLEIQVLPFELLRPADRAWLLYCDPFRWETMSDLQVEAELRDIARHGFTGLVELPLGRPDGSGLAAGRASVDAGVYIRRARQCRAAGLPGPHVCVLPRMAQAVRDTLGLTCDLTTGVWPSAVRTGVTAVARAAVSATAGAPGRWYFYGVDEPRGNNTYAIQDYECWRRGGALSYATFFDLAFLEKAGPSLAAACSAAGLVSQPADARAIRERCAGLGIEFWWYGTGSYVNPFPQESSAFPNRYGAGCLFWKTGARVQVSWTFCRPHEDPFNDFDGSRDSAAEPKDQAIVYPHLLKPADWSTYQGAIPTLAWESLREGIDDYAYLYTLSVRIARARDGDRADLQEKAREAETRLCALIEAIPWLNPLEPPPGCGSGFGVARMQEIRRAVADLVIGLNMSPAL